MVFGGFVVVIMVVVVIFVVFISVAAVVVILIFCNDSDVLVVLRMHIELICSIKAAIINVIIIFRIEFIIQNYYK